MTEWTSISLKKAQKDVLLEGKPEDMSMGSYLVELCDENDLADGNCIDPADVKRAAYEGSKRAVEELVDE